MRLMADGSHDADFPIIEAMPQGLNTHISKIERASDGTWYVSGRFEGINGHITPHIAHLSADFEVDTDFVSPFVYESVCCGLHMEMKLLDSQDRMWFSADNVKLASEPDEIYHLIRLLPDGTVDASFQKGQLTATYPEEYDMYPTVITKVIEPDLADDVFFIGGFFSHYNGVAQPSISALDDEGIIQSNYFNNQGPSLNSWNPQFPDWIDAPSVRGLEFLPDGSLMVGGSFSDFMGAERYNIVRLIQGTVSTEDPSADFGQFKMYPNPANDFIQMEFQLLFEKEDTEMRVYDQLGRLVKTYTIGLNTSGVEVLDTRKYGQGVYIVEIVQEGKQVFSDKFIVQH
jgi:hypothetical protein